MVFFKINGSDLNKIFLFIIVLLSISWSIPSFGFAPADLKQFKKTPGKCPRCNLSGADLSGLQLRMGNLSGANLSGANLSGTMFLRMDLTNVNFTNANLEKTSWSNSDLKGAIFDGAKWSPKYHEELQTARNIPDGVLPGQTGKKRSTEQLITEVEKCKAKLEDRENKYSQCNQTTQQQNTEINQLRQTINKNKGKVGGYDQLVQNYDELLVLFEERKEEIKNLEERIEVYQNAGSGSHVSELGQMVETFGGECGSGSTGSSPMVKAPTDEEIKESIASQKDADLEQNYITALSHDRLVDECHRKFGLTFEESEFNGPLASMIEELIISKGIIDQTGTKEVRGKISRWESPDSLTTFAKGWDNTLGSQIGQLDKLREAFPDDRGEATCQVFDKTLYQAVMEGNGVNLGSQWLIDTKLHKAYARDLHETLLYQFYGGYLDLKDCKDSGFVDPKVLMSARKLAETSEKSLVRMGLLSESRVKSLWTMVTKGEGDNKITPEIVFAREMVVKLKTNIMSSQQRFATFCQNSVEAMTVMAMASELPLELFIGEIKKDW
jgi:hypothetical protein